jgi:hypothetical protein
MIADLERLMLGIKSESFENNPAIPVVGVEAEELVGLALLDLL